MTFETVVDFAIEKEEEARAFYLRLAEMSEPGPLKESLLSFAREEAGHKARLQALKESRGALSSKKVSGDMRLSDYLVESTDEPAGDYQELLILAMKKEKAAYRLYTDLAALVEEESLVNLLSSLAAEEANHKLRFEVEYERIYLTEL